MPLARRDDPKIDDNLPDPRLSPLTNPRLGKNLGRWADVYYNTPPELRDEAVLALVRELEGGPPMKAAASRNAESDRSPRRSGNGSSAPSFPAPTRFCMMCGSPAKGRDIHSTTKNGGDGELGHANAVICELRAPSHSSDDSRANNESHSKDLELEGTNEIPSGMVVDPVEIHASSLTSLTEELESSERTQTWKHLLVVLTIAAAVGAWGVRWIRLTSTPPLLGMTSTRSPNLGPPKVDALPKSSQEKKAASLSVPTPVKFAPARSSVIIASSSSQRKPSAGQPVECRNDLQNCSSRELQQKTMALASAIDGLYLQHDRRTKQLLRRAVGQGGMARNSRSSRLRQANYSAHISERVQLQSYLNHERRLAVKYRAELMRRANAPASEKPTSDLYSHPKSCLDLHYIAEDLRRLGSRLPRKKPTSDAPRRVSNLAPFHK
jgi:hypothetical protein